MLALATAFAAGMLALPLVRAIRNARDMAKADALSTVEALKQLLEKSDGKTSEET